MHDFQCRERMLLLTIKLSPSLTTKERSSINVIVYCGVYRVRCCISRSGWPLAHSTPANSGMSTSTICSCVLVLDSVACKVFALAWESWFCWSKLSLNSPVKQEKDWYCLLNSKHKEDEHHEDLHTFSYPSVDVMDFFKDRNSFYC